jgi:hypothetical protein
LLGVAGFGAFYFYNRWVLQALAWLLQGLAWVLQALVLNKCGCTRLPASCLRGYCSGSVGLDVFGLWEISFFFLCSDFVRFLIMICVLFVWFWGFFRWFVLYFGLVRFLIVISLLFA